MTTEAQKRAHAAHRERLRAQGIRSVTIRLTPAAWDRLDALAKVHGSKDKAVEAMLLPSKSAATPAPRPIKSRLKGEWKAP